MAVQAQYPSNVFLLNRSVKEEKGTIGDDYLMQPKPGVLDQSPMIFTHGAGANSRKRGRSSVNTVSLQSQGVQLLDLTQLNTPHPNTVSTGLRLASSDQHHHLSPQSSQSSGLLSVLSDDLATQIKHQRDEIDHLLQTQGEQLRRTLAEKRQRHYRALLVAMEESVARRLKEAEAEAERAVRRNSELEANAAQLTVELQAWQARARLHEATVAMLQEQLQQVIACSGVRGQGEGEELLRTEAEDAESNHVDQDRVVAVSGPGCRACRKRAASVVLFPCRHICLCLDCARVAQYCPSCRVFKESSIEVLLC